MGRKRIPTSPASPFYGYPAELIAEWCGVSVGTAQHYKAGRRKPPTPVLRLFRLYRDGKVLGPEWEGFIVHGNMINGPDGKVISQTQLLYTALLAQRLSEDSPTDYQERLEEFHRELGS